MTEAIATNGTATKAVATNGHAPATQVLRMVALSQIVASKTNPRQHFDEADLRELADSIKQLGVVQPIVLRPLKGKAENADDRSLKYEIVAGERRVRASRLAELTEIPANVRELSDKMALEIQMIENLQRKDLSPLEEADGLARMVRDHGYKPKELGDKIGKSATYVLRHLKLADLHPKLRLQIEREEISIAHAMLLARLPDHALQLEARKDIMLPYNPTQFRPLKEAAKVVSAKYMLPLDKAPFDITDKILVPAAGNCTDCAHRTGNAKDLFDDVKEKDLCTKPSCYQNKVSTWWDKHETKERKLPLAQSDALFWPHGDMRSESKYFDLTAREPWMKSGETYGSITKLKVAPMLAMDPLGVVRKVALKKDVDAVLKTMKRGPSKKPAGSRPSGGGSSKPKLTETEKKREFEYEIDEAFDKRIEPLLIEQSAELAEKMSDTAYFDLLIRMVAQSTYCHGDFLAARKAKGGGALQKQFEKTVEAIPRSKKRGALLQLAVVALSASGDLGVGDDDLTKEICAALKIDVAKIRKEVRAELEKKQAAAAKPAAKSKPKKK